MKKFALLMAACVLSTSGFASESATLTLVKDAVNSDFQSIELTQSKDAQALDQVNHLNNVALISSNSVLTPITITPSQLAQYTQPSGDVVIPAHVTLDLTTDLHLAGNLTVYGKVIAHPDTVLDVQGSLAIVSTDTTSQSSTQTNTQSNISTSGTLITGSTLSSTITFQQNTTQGTIGAGSTQTVTVDKTEKKSDQFRLTNSEASERENTSTKDQSDKETAKLLKKIRGKIRS